jgi:hypothetical protein
MKPELPRIPRGRYSLPEHSEYLILGPYFKTEDMIVGRFPRGSTCWYAILKWRGMELFITGATARDAVAAAAEKVLYLAGGGDQTSGSSSDD